MPNLNETGAGNTRRSRSPNRDVASAAIAAGPLPKGSAVLFFHTADPACKKGSAFVRPSPERTWLLQSHGWLHGVLQQPFDASTLDAADEKTWPLVLPQKDLLFVDRTGKKPDKAASAARRCFLVREASTLRMPLLSLVLVRWGGTYSAWMDDEAENDGDWGKYGSPPSDSYMTALVNQGVANHPQLTSKGLCGVQPEYEIFQLFVGSSRDVALIKRSAAAVAGVMTGRRKTSFWMLWPAEWEDSGDPDFACYAERHALFQSMRACEAVGIRSAFPHPSDLYEIITSKSWMATLCLNTGAHLPAAAMVSRDLISSDPSEAARHALATLEHVRHICPFPREPDDDAPAPSVINKDAIQKGMVKVGWSWENRFVLSFSGAKHLEARMTELMALPGCMASYCIVQEWADFDFEMRQYYLLPAEWAPGALLEPTRIECNIWGERNEKAGAGTPASSFSKLSEAEALKHWDDDVVCWEDAKAKATRVAQFVLSWLRVVNAQPVPMIRLDFMLKRLGPGKARVIFGEYCEVGACCLGWKEGPPSIWRVVLDSVLRGS